METYIEEGSVKKIPLDSNSKETLRRDIESLIVQFNEKKDQLVIFSVELSEEESELRIHAVSSPRGIYEACFVVKQGIKDFIEKL